MNLNPRRAAIIGVLLAFLANSFGIVPLARAEDFRLPAPGVMIHLSPPLNPPILTGIKVHPDNPLRFDFILDKGDSQLNNAQLKNESTKLIKYFLASLTIPEKDLWVNLSPYEKDRIVPNSFGQTEMGRDLLAEDYMLKQITASLIYPEGKTGKKFWKRIYEEAAKKFGTTNFPVNTFNKVWIVPQKAIVYENAKAGTAYVVESKLKVMLEQDYLSLQKHEGIRALPQVKDTNQLGSQIVREIVIPQLTKEVNENKNFAQLRQVYNSLILATWYKKKIKESILAQVYENKNKVAGVNIGNRQEKQRIYERYLQAFKKGVYNYIKEEIDPITQQPVPRKYFSGGLIFKLDDQAMTILDKFDVFPVVSDDMSMVSVDLVNALSLKAYDRASMSIPTELQEKLKIELGLSQEETNYAVRIMEQGLPTDVSSEQAVNLITNFLQPIFRANDKDKIFMMAGLMTLIQRWGRKVIDFQVPLKAIFSRSPHEKWYLFSSLSALGQIIDSPEDLLFVFGRLKKLQSNLSSELNREMVLRQGMVKWGRFIKDRQSFEQMIKLFEAMEVDSLTPIITITNLKPYAENPQALLEDLIHNGYLKKVFYREPTHFLTDGFRKLTSPEKMKLADEFKERRNEIFYFLKEIQKIKLQDFNWDGVYGNDLLAHTDDIASFLRTVGDSIPVFYLTHLRENYLKEFSSPATLEQDRLFFQRHYLPKILTLTQKLNPGESESLIQHQFLNLKRAAGKDFDEIFESLVELPNQLQPISDERDNFRSLGYMIISYVTDASKYNHQRVILKDLFKRAPKFTARQLYEIMETDRFESFSVLLKHADQLTGQQFMDLLRFFKSGNWYSFPVVEKSIGNMDALNMMLDGFFELSGKDALDVLEGLFSIKESIRTQADFQKWSKSILRLIPLTDTQSRQRIWQILRDKRNILYDTKFFDLLVDVVQSGNQVHLSTFGAFLDFSYSLPEEVLQEDSFRNTFDRYAGLLSAGIYPLGEFFTKYADYTPDFLSKRAQSVRSGAMSIEDDFEGNLDVALNYSNLVGDMKIYGDSREISFAEFSNMVEQIRRQNGRAKQAWTQISENEQRQIRGLVYEASLTYQKILEIQEHAKSLGRPVVVVENLSYGAVALAPITQEQRATGRKFIVGTDIPVISTKIGSTESHHNEFVLRQDLFTSDQIKDFMTREPIVIVVDGSTSVSDSNRTSAHIPDGFKGYRNYFMALNLALTGEIKPESFYEDSEFVQGLEGNGDFKVLTDRLKQEVSEKTENWQPYQLKFWYPGNKDLYLKVNKQKVEDRIAPKMDIEEITGPAVIFIQSGLEKEAVPQEITRDYIQGEHTPVYFDDKDHYKRFFFNYKPGWGFVLSKQYMDYSRQEFKRFLEFNGKFIEESSIPAVLSGRDIHTIALDLDGTIATLGGRPSPEMIATLKQLIEADKQIVILTDDIEANVDDRLKYLLETIPGSRRHQLTIFSDSATKGYTFRFDGSKVYLSEYNQESKLGQDIQNPIRDIINSDLRAQLDFENRANRLSPDARIDLIVRDGFSRTNVLTQLKQTLRQKGIGVKVYKTGRYGIRIVRAHKEHGLREFMDIHEANEENLLIMADSARTDQMDRELLNQFPHAVNVNLGLRSKTFLRKGAPVFQMRSEFQGPQGAFQILQYLAKRGHVPEMENMAIVYHSRSEHADAAMLDKHKSNLGGIDLTPANMNIQTQNNGGEINFRLDPAMIKQLQNAPGFVPVIINIQPMTNLRQFLSVP